MLYLLCCTVIHKFFSEKTLLTAKENSFATVVADTSMITMSPEYAAHFHDIYIDGKECAKMTGDCMKMLMLTLPFLVRDLI